MLGYIPFCAPCDDTMPGFLSLYPDRHRPEDSMPSPSELAAHLMSRCLRRRPAAAVFLSLDEPSASKNPRRQESDEDSETELNENCSACRRRRERKLNNRRRRQRPAKANVGDRKSSTADASGTDEVEKSRSGTKDIEAVAAKNIRGQTAENVDDQKFVIRLDVNGFDPEHIQVKVKDGILEIDAKSEGKSSSTGIYTFRELHRRYTLPTDMNPDDVTSFLHSDGYLSIEAPRKPLLNDAALPHKADSNGEVVEGVKDQ